jgi:hypothetical protein
VAKVSDTPNARQSPTLTTAVPPAPRPAGAMTGPAATVPAVMVADPAAVADVAA